MTAAIEHDPPLVGNPKIAEASAIIAPMWLLAALIGAALGGVINVLADGLPPDERGQRRPLNAPRCRGCRTPYPAALWPASGHWFTARGACPHCGASRGWRAPMVELGMATGSALLWGWAGGDVGRFYAALTVVTIFGLIAVIDIEHRLILWRTVWISALILLVIGAVMMGWPKTLAGGAVGYGIVFGMYLAGQLYEWAVARLRGKPLDEIAFGGGDVNLAGLVGLAVGWSGVLFALLIGIFTAAAFSLGLAAWQIAHGRSWRDTPFPYGPFLVLGALVMYLFGREFAQWWFGPG
jgi:prepilin signal peptidase PulO-like enzyme (type II secretory pathway)